MKIIPVAKPEIGKAERKAVDRVMRSGLLAQGPEVSSFEKEFSKFVGDRECVAVNSGTSALHVALLSLGIGKGDEVIVPSFTFAATANSVALTGAAPVFVDIDPITFCIDPIEIVKAITPKTKAIQVVHLYGLAAEMPAIMKIAKKYKLLVIEDAAQAHLASIEGKPVGTFGDAAAFSFYPTKNMTSGEGGMIVFKDSSAARTARLFRNQGMEKRYENELVGFNLRMTDIHAAIGRVQLSKLEEKTLRRQENAAYLSENIIDPSKILNLIDFKAHNAITIIHWPNSPNHCVRLFLK
jgi:dTDP-4-amino-4,6-dideoxygalactose transaminase